VPRAFTTAAALAGLLSVGALVAIRGGAGPDPVAPLPSAEREEGVEAAREAAIGSWSGDSSTLPPPVAPPPELLAPPPTVQRIPDEDRALSHPILPDASWGEWLAWFPVAPPGERELLCDTLLSFEPREEGLDRLLLLLDAIPVDAGAVTIGLTLGRRSMAGILDSRAELERFRRVLMRGSSVGARSFALPPVLAGARIEGVRTGVLEAIEIAFYSVRDPGFAAALLEELPLFDAPVRAGRLAREAIRRAEDAPPGTGWCEVAALGVEGTLSALAEAETRLSSGALPIGDPIREEVRLAREVGLRQTLLDALVRLGSAEGRSEEERARLLELLERRGRAHAARLRSLGSSREGPDEAP